MLVCSRFRGRHTAESISEKYDDILTSFELCGKVNVVVTDNAANMKKAFLVLPGLQINHGSSDSDGEEDTPETTEPSDLLDYIPDHSACFCHTLQLVVKDGLQVAGQMTKVFAKVARLVNHVHHSSVDSALFDDDFKLQMSNATRWKSQLNMLRSLLKVKETTLEKVNFTPKPTKYELKLIEELCEILLPFETATMETQGQNKVTASLIIPCIRGLRAEMCELGEKYKSSMVSTLKSFIEKRLVQYEDKEVFQLASCLDPRFKFQWCTDEEAEKLKRLLVKKVKELLPQTEEQRTVQPPTKKSKLFRFMDKVPELTPSTALQQVEKYVSTGCLDENSDPLLYWSQNAHQYPELARLSCKYLMIPASSAPVERLFSVAGKIFRPDRCRLSDERFEDLMFLRCNSV